MTFKKLGFMVVALVVGCLQAGTVFIEAESFDASDGGWVNKSNREGSGVAILHGASGSTAGVARKSVKLDVGGSYRVWVRYLYVTAQRGPFDLSVSVGGKTLAKHSFDVEAMPDAKNQEFVWAPLDVDLPAGEIVLELAKYNQKNCSGYTRQIDCLVLTTDLDKTAPDYLKFGPQTYVRVTIGDIDVPPVYVHIFVNHFRRPYFGHYTLSKAGTGKGLAPAAADRLLAGGQTPWCNISDMLFQDSGAMLKTTLRHNYQTRPERLKARFEFATAPNAAAIVRTMDVDAQPNGVVFIVPPNLLTEENRSRLGRDLDYATKTGKIADSYDWPAIGKKPSLFPFYASFHIGGDIPASQDVVDRELKTLDYFGFSNFTRLRHGARTWRMFNNSFCQPDMTAITNAAAVAAAELIALGKKPSDVDFGMLMDEPTGQPLSFIVQDAAYHEAFRNWLKGKSLTPAELLVANWDAVVLVTEQQREDFPALYYYSQRFRTQALGDFIATQRKAIEKANGGSYPINVNFSDGSVYYCNFYNQGVDYFELLDDDGQNAIWGSDWANGSSSYQCGAYNIDLMRAAARDRGQVIGNYIISHAWRRGLDLKLKGVGTVARGAKMLQCSSYGAYWGTHEGGPSWESHVWGNQPQLWRPIAEMIREVGAVEEMLLPAMPPPAEVAILYSSSSDIWTLNDNRASAFNRLHTWMALTHAQIPVDFISEAQAAAGALEGYRVCYLSGPNLTRTASEQVVKWVHGGGTLVADVDAATRDEYNRPLATISKLLPAERGNEAMLQIYKSSGSYLWTLESKDRVTMTGSGTEMNVLSVRQPLTPRPNTDVLGTYKDSTPAWVRGTFGKGTVHLLGFFPALDYIHHALAARQALVKQVKENEPVGIDGLDSSRDNAPLDEKGLSVANRFRLEASTNPWDFPNAVREAIVAPAREAGINPPIVCNVPVVDAVYMTCDAGIVIPLANYTLYPLNEVEFLVRVERAPVSVESVYHGKIDFRQVEKGGQKWIAFSLPLASTDFISIRWK